MMIAFTHQQQQTSVLTSTERPSTTVTYPYRALSCSFEADYCSWTNDVKAKANWTRNSGPTLSDFTGPISDVTTQSITGHYIYINSFRSGINDTARLLSLPVTLRPNGYCFKFWYLLL